MNAATDRSTPHASAWNHQQAKVNGIDLHYVREGNGAPIVLLHGWPEFWYTWHRNIPVLATQFDVITPDLRGFGRSEKPPGSALDSYTIDHHAEDLAQLTRALGIEKFALVSHDVGAGVAQTFARKWPERLTGLFFTNCPYPGIGKRWASADHIEQIWYQTFHQQAWSAELLGRDRRNCEIYFSAMLAHWSYDPHAFDDQLTHWIDNFMQPGNLQGGFNWYIAQHESRMALVRDGAPSLAPIEVPTRLLWGGSDPVILARWTDRLGDYFSNFQCEIHEEAGHFVHFEQADDTNRAIIEFFSSAAVTARN